FDLYAKACYDFFWRDFCDWYLEAIKPAMRDPQRAPQTARVLAAVLDASLRLMHPIIPFITEIIWWNFNATCPQRGLPGAIAGCTGELLVTAAWPKPDPSVVNESAEQSFGLLQEIIGAIRVVRNEHKVEPRRRVSVSLGAG